MRRPPDQNLDAVEIAPGVHWVGAFDPDLRNFDLILRTANGTTYNAYTVRGDQGVAVIDTVKENFADDFFGRLEAVCNYDEITTIVVNHLEPDHSGALPELLKRAPGSPAPLRPALTWPTSSPSVVVADSAKSCTRSAVSAAWASPGLCSRLSARRR